MSTIEAHPALPCASRAHLRCDIYSQNIAALQLAKGHLEKAPQEIGMLFSVRIVGYVRQTGGRPRSQHVHIRHGPKPSPGLVASALVPTFGGAISWGCGCLPCLFAVAAMQLSHTCGSQAPDSMETWRAAVYTSATCPLPGPHNQQGCPWQDPASTLPRHSQGELGV
jgi:hypothetical protein